MLNVFDLRLRRLLLGRRRPGRNRRRRRTAVARHAELLQVHKLCELLIHHVLLHSLESRGVRMKTFIVMWHELCPWILKH